MFVSGIWRVHCVHMIRMVPTPPPPQCYCVTLLLFIFYLLYYLFYLCKLLCTKKKKFPRFLITCCVLVNVYNVIVFKLYYQSSHAPSNHLEHLSNTSHRLPLKEIKGISQDRSVIETWGWARLTRGSKQPILNHLNTHWPRPSNHCRAP